MGKIFIYYRELLSKYINNTCTPAEAEKILTFLQKNESNRLLIKQLGEEFDNIDTPVSQVESYSQRIKEVLNKKLNEASVVQLPKRRWSKMAAAAIILILISCGYLLINQFSEKKDLASKEDISLRYKNDIKPGGENAILVLANGEKIALDSATNGALAEQGGINVVKLNNGQLTYTTASDGNAVNSEVLYNNIITPRGGQYKIILSDGTAVWLNASSSMRFPASFIGKERRVEITGEAYFEVKKNTAKPFIVKINGEAEVEVLGTDFNIMAYDDEAVMKTTLLEGAINIKSANEVKQLKPGQQAQVGEGKIKVFNDADINQAIAWKNGLFDFNDDEIVDIMRQLSRWYDIDVHYDGVIPEGHYVGTIRRKENISEVLKMLEFAGDIRFKIDGRRVIVKKGK